MNKIPIIIDTDPGVDDTTAIVMCMASEKLDIQGVTTVGGNVELVHTSNNARDIIKLTGRTDVMVAKGESKPLERELVSAAHIHGEKGMGILELEKSKKSFLEEHASEFIYKTARNNKGELRILTIGPLTNIAMAIQKHKDIIPMIHSIVSMGGAMGVGNVTPAAEYNIYADPEAAKIVFDSGIVVTIVGLDVTIPTIVNREQNKVIRSMGSKVSKVVADLNDYQMDKESPYNPAGAIMHDPLAAAYIIDPTILKTEKYYVNVVCDNGLARGMTLVDKYRLSKKEPNVYVAMEANNEKFIALLFGLLHTYCEK